MIIVYANPDKDGHCGEILKTIEENLTERKISFETLDLYEDNRYSFFSKKEKANYGKSVSKEIKEIQKMISNSEKIIFVYPSWWNYPPAILKSFFEKVFTPNFAFKYIHNIPKPLLSMKGLIIATSGSPTFVDSIMLSRRLTKSLKRDILDFCGIKAKDLIIGGCIGKISEKKKKEIHLKVSKKLNLFL